MTNKFLYGSTIAALVLVLLLTGCSTSAIEYYTRGLTAYNESDYFTALKNFQQSIEIDPNNAQTHYYCGLTYEQTYAKADPELAIDEYTKAISLDQDFAEAYYNRGLMCYTYYQQLFIREQAAEKAAEMAKNQSSPKPPNIDSNIPWPPRLTLSECKNMAISDFRTCLSLNISAEMRQSAETYLQELEDTP